MHSRDLSGKVRIIGGRWRGRRLRVSNVSELRPTGDRIRETLFNWLSPAIAESRCLDLFAGSGVLGFECLSRGARDVVLVERSRDVYEHLQALVTQFGEPSARIVCADALCWLREPHGPPFDIIFLDPPYHYALLKDVCFRLEQSGQVSPGGYVYLEQEAGKPATELPSNWTITHEKKAGRVRYYLARRF